MKLTTLRPRLKEMAPKLQTLNSNSWRSGKTTTQRGYGYQWQQARVEFLKERSLCIYCERQGLVVRASVVDHIKPHNGDQNLFWDRTNWQPLCKTCHDTTKAREEGRQGAKPRIGFNAGHTEERQ